MSHIPLHNALALLKNQIGATALAIKFTSSNHDWPALDIGVGDLAQLDRIEWRDDDAPSEPNEAIDTDLFGIRCAARTQTPTEDLWRVAVLDALLHAVHDQFLFVDQRDEAPLVHGTLWVGAAYQDASQRLDAHAIGVIVQLCWSLHVLPHALRDPVTGFPGTQELRQRLEKMQREDAGLLYMLFDLSGLLPDSIERYARALGAAVRKNDGLFSLRPDTVAFAGRIRGEEAADQVIAKLATLSPAPGEPGLSLPVSYVYVAPGEAADIDLHALSLAAHAALRVARDDGSGIPQQALPFFAPEAYPTAHPLGSPLNETARNQRNSDILWRTVSTIAALTDRDQLCEAFIDTVATACSLTVARILDVDVTTKTLRTEHPTGIDATGETSIQRALTSANTETEFTNGIGYVAVPMVAHTRLYGILFLQASHAFDTSDTVFFKALADQLAGALDRLALAEAQIAASKSENRALRTELDTLRAQIAPPPQQVAESQVMREVLATVNKVAKDDVSVLILGESGVGKEVMAHTIHQDSPRRDGPFVIVDVTTLTSSLIEAELFGRVKGAYTGADEASPGRIAQAHGGTLFLDEIGELPLHVQAKLLRFVQEKQVIPVGGTESRYVDTRIICATNRNLTAEVSAGRFRTDLYYRLQVIQIAVPPLRERQADLPFIAQNLLAKFKSDHPRDITDLDVGALQKLMSYSWPGNVRELHNTLLRAYLTAEGGVITVDDIELTQELAAISPQKDVFADAIDTSPIAQNPALPAGSAEEQWEVLRALLTGQFRALPRDQLKHAPIGRWLHDAVILTAYDFSGQVVRNAAKLLGVAETTLRRQIKQAQDNQANPLNVTTEQWQLSQQALTDIITSLLKSHIENTPFVDAIEAELVAIVIEFAGDDTKTGAAMLGVSPPTYRRRLKKHQAATAAPEQAASAHTGLG